MICSICNINISSEKIYYLHKQRCKQKQQNDKQEQPKGYNSFSWPELKQLASDKGINTYSMKKEEVINALKDLEV